MYSQRISAGPVDLAFTDRFGGVSAAPFDELNLALVGDDDPASTAANLRLLADDFAPGCAIVTMHQVHGAEVVTVSTEPGRTPSTRPDCDALVTAEEDLVLVVRVADCVPVLLADQTNGVIGAAHAGRPGLVAGVVPATVERMRALGAGRSPGDITAWIGPHVCGACYEVPEQMRSDVAALEPDAFAVTSWGTPALDIGAGVRAQLDRDGVAVHDESRCTRESPDLYSYRRDGAGAGRFAGVIVRRRREEQS